MSLAFKKGLAVRTEKQHGPQGKEWCMNVYKSIYLKVKTHFHCRCRFISHFSCVWRKDHQEHRRELWKYLTATNKMLNWMWCDVKHISWHGFHHCSIWTEESQYKLQLNYFTPAKTTVAFFILLNLPSLHVSHTAPPPWMERRARCPLSIEWHHGISTKDKFQYAVPDHSDAELALNIIHFSQPPSPKSPN